MELSGRLHQDIRLEEVQATTIKHDIRMFVEDECFKIRTKQRRNPYNALPPDWPGTDSIQALVRLAVPLFITASTVCRYISESDPSGRLDEILRQQSNESFSGLKGTYAPILNRILRTGDKRECTLKIAAFQDLVGPIVLLKDPLSAISLSKLLDLPLSKLGEVLMHLHSVLDIPEDANISIRPFHLSFCDFLVDPQTQGENSFWIDETKTHANLAQQCLRLLNRPGILGQDMCNAKRPGTRRADISKHQVTCCIPADVAYACCYWVQHLTESRGTICDDDPVHKFLEIHFLHWMEALSWLRRLSNIVQFVTDLRSRVQVSHV